MDIIELSVAMDVMYPMEALTRTAVHSRKTYPHTPLRSSLYCVPQLSPHRQIRENHRSIWGCLTLGGGCRRYRQDDLGRYLPVFSDFYPIYDHQKRLGRSVLPGV